MDGDGLGLPLQQVQSLHDVIDVFSQAALGLGSSVLELLDANLEALMQLALLGAVRLRLRLQALDSGL